MNSLGSLDISGTQISDAGLPYLRKLSYLDFLNVCDTKVTREGVEQLHKELPGPNIVWGKKDDHKLIKGTGVIRLDEEEWLMLD